MIPIFHRLFLASLLFASSVSGQAKTPDQGSGSPERSDETALSAALATGRWTATAERPYRELVLGQAKASTGETLPVEFWQWLRRVADIRDAGLTKDERIITCEDSAELQLQQPHVVRLETRPPNIEGEGEITMRDLVKNCLRMRPERIIVGEVRGPEVFDLLQAMNTGHDGSMGTIHSNSPRECLNRMESMIAMGGFSLPSRTVKEIITGSVDVIVQAARLRDGSRRITHITEVERMEGDVITLQDIFVYDASLGFDADGRSLGRLRPTGLRPKFLEKMAYSNVTVDPMVFATDRM